MLHRENYLTDHSLETKIQMHSLVARYSGLSVRSLLANDNWREVIVGIYLVGVARIDQFVSELEEILISGRMRIVRRPAILALTLLENRRGEFAVRRFLQLPYQEDSADDYAAGFEAASHIGLSDVTEPTAPILARLKAESWFDVEAFTVSRNTFASAIAFWAS
jgi:hypothetical protein